ncbi:4-hydroxythreonine-4-phosphate dehydrogenase PdxA [Methylotenera sp. N17]|uniref:4-hydroxythreonine-4-phosphate dehydrogenase PdxA n=1 Tax=Methylotenera sp. N17 TaxID=1502761 RepID=UPI0006463A6B|nr:4-hydroxythreonine-4-phosphate dehydrogenase PdxA [Methylotenera sp. N17]
MNALPRIAVTAGEPAGIGLDLCVMLAQTPLSAQVTVIADADALLARAAQLHLPLTIHPYSASQPEHSGNSTLRVSHVPSAAPIVTGKLDANNSPYVLHTLKVAMDGCLENSFDAMVTAPVQKSIINDAGIAFTGHTEFLAEYTHTERVVMMLVGGGMRVALATIHLPLTQVSAAVTTESLTQTIQILHHDLQQRFGIASPKIFVAGLNPHAGEGGYLGNEEITTITPVLNSLRAQGMQLIGPLPADTMYSPKNIEEADAFLAMYHDQGLAVLKYASFGAGVNVTLGLPIIRTSVDHGTALDIAGTGKAEVGSLLAAIQLAIDIAQHTQ